MKGWRRVVLWVVVAAVFVFVVIQFIPYGRDRSNPAVEGEPAWNSPRTRELAKQACFDCHSNETVWPWYANIAPVSWLVYSDVVSGRESVNFSEWSTGMNLMVDDIAGQIQEGEMPPSQYKIMHSEAQLSDSEKQELIDGFRATMQ